MNTINKESLINEEIREKEVRVLSADGEALGFMSSKEALEIAEKKQLDLVLIAPQAKPPVVKIMDYGKYLYEQQKRDKEARKKQKVVNMKEVRISPTIEAHDLGVKAKNAAKFLEDGDKVKVTVRFRGREADYSHFGKELLNTFFEKVSEVGVIEKPAKLEGRNMIMILAPKKA
ncbi:MAG: translation initiation factor IF-3 [Clostridium sp.]